MYITDIQLIKKLSIKNEDRNWRFRSFLKMQDGNRIDSLVKPIYESVIEQIDCKSCGNCCRELQPVITDKDIKKLETELGFSKEKIIEELTDKNELNEIELKGKPCPFLEGNICRIYNNRPEDCVSFPHVHKKGFTTRLMGMIEFAEICPIVFNVYEELKFTMKFR